MLTLRTKTGKLLTILQGTDKKSFAVVFGIRIDNKDYETNKQHWERCSVIKKMAGVGRLHYDTVF